MIPNCSCSAGRARRVRPALSGLANNREIHHGWRVVMVGCLPTWQRVAGARGHLTPSRRPALWPTMSSKIEGHDHGRNALRGHLGVRGGCRPGAVAVVRGPGAPGASTSSAPPASRRPSSMPGGPHAQGWHVPLQLARVLRDEFRRHQDAGVPINVNYRYLDDELAYLFESPTSRCSCSTLARRPRGPGA